MNSGEQMAAWLQTPEGQAALKRGRERMQQHPLSKKARRKIARVVREVFSSPARVGVSAQDPESPER